MEEFNWDLPPTRKERPIEDGDIRLVTIEVEALFEKGIVATDWDEDGNVLQTKEGFLVHALSPKVYNGEPTVFISQMIKEVEPTVKPIELTCDICSNIDEPTYNLCDKHQEEFEKFKKEKHGKKNF